MDTADKPGKATAGRAGWFALGMALLALWAGALGATAPSAVPLPTEPPAPDASPAVQKLLEEAAQLAKERKSVEALVAAERALAAAKQAEDAAGEARSQRERARALQALQRAPEAVAAWGAAATAWQRAGDGPSQVEAQVSLALLIMAEKPMEAQRLMEEGVRLAQAEALRPLAAAAYLHAAGDRASSLRLPSLARPLTEAALAIREKLAPGSLDVAASLAQLGYLIWAGGDPTVAQNYHERALAIRESLAPGSVDMAASLNSLGVVAYDRGDLAAAREYHQRALSIRESLAPGSMNVATSLNNLGVVARSQRDAIAARAYLERALAIREKLAPGSMNVAASLINMASVARDQDDWAAARDYALRALAICEKLAPGSLDMAQNLNHLGAIAHDQGDRAAAHDYHQRALIIREKLAPESADVASNLNSLGNVASDQGDLAAARDYHQRALIIRERLNPGSLDVARSLTTLGAIAGSQGDLAAAHYYLQRALVIDEKLGPGSERVALGLANVGAVALSRGDPAARGYFQRALKIHEKLAPGSHGIAIALNNLGAIARRQGDRAAARDYYQRALTVSEKLAPESLAVSLALENLGVVTDDLVAARGYHQRALAINENLAPGSLGEAVSLNNLGYVAQQQGNLQEAVERTARAWQIVRKLGTSVSGDEAQLAFTSSKTAFAADLIWAQSAAGEPVAAFTTLEESRAQALQERLLERGITARLAPPDVWQAYQEALTAHNRALKALEQPAAAEGRAQRALNAAQEPGADEAVLTEKRRAVEQAQADAKAPRDEEVRTRVEMEKHWRVVKRSLRQAPPEPRPLDETRRSLPPGTLFLAFSVGDKRTTLILARRDGPVAASSLAISRAALKDRVDRFRQSVLSKRSADRVLFQTLFPPEAQAAIAHAQRLVISPDDVLWNLPFAALVMNPAGTGSPHYLGLEKPLTYAQSLTLYAMARQAPVPSAPGRLTALVVGNPLYDNAERSKRRAPRPAPARAGKRLATAASPSKPTVKGAWASRQARGEVRTLTRDGEPPPPLPHAMAEAREVAQFYGATAHSGEQPTEAWFRQQAGKADIIHLATHGYFNPFQAMSSGVLLAVPERPAPGKTDDDGALQAWELMSEEQLRLRAELVVLSACETGQGRTVASEGLVGLTRALQVAGARSIVASQWQVGDASTAALMVTFHRKLRAGKAKDEALREAMTKMRETPQWAHPYYWAGFLLVGAPENGGFRQRGGAGLKASRQNNARH